MARQPVSNRFARRSASGLVRTFVVATATLAILLVLFSIYQSSQLSTVGPAPAKPRNFPDSRSLPEMTVDADKAAQHGVKVGDAILSSGQRVRISLYPREGSEAFAEVTVDEWEPMEGSPHKWQVVSPEVRMSTKDGHAVRATAKRGVLDGRRRGANLDFQRGVLSNDVVIEYDRLTREERAKLPAELQKHIDPNQIMRFEAQQVEFDREYMKLVIPGECRLWSPVDVDFRAVDVDVRFDEQANRVETMRIAGGGSLELKGPVDKMGLPLPRVEPTGPQRTTIADWLRNTLQAKLGAKPQPPPRQPPAAAPEPAITVDDQGVPTFNLNAKPPKKPRAPVRYIAKFNQDVIAKQLHGAEAVSQLFAESLEIERDFVPDDATTGSQASAAPLAGPPSRAAQVEAQEKIRLTWSGLLVLTTSDATQTTSADAPFTKVTARGAPARVVSRDGDASCATLVYEPGVSATWLTGSPDVPVIVQSSEIGKLTGPEVKTQQVGDALNITVTGPANLVRVDAGNNREGASPRNASIEFGEKLEAVVRMAKVTRLDVREAAISTEDRRLLERAAFAGKVRLRDGDTALSSDTLDCTFAAGERRASGQQPIEKLLARGDVAMTRGPDRLTGDELEATFGADPSGRAVAKLVTVVGHASAVQGDRAIRASDKLIAEFAPSDTPSESESLGGVALKRIRAYGDVNVVDAVQKLDLTAHELDATITDGNLLEIAEIKGDADRPAYVRLDDYSVSGRVVRLSAVHDWAEVPGEGRMTFQSRKDLDGRVVDTPIPINVTWKDRMRYEGREKRAVFTGLVHATSEAGTTFDADEWVIEFEDAPPPAASASAKRDWWVLQKAVDAWAKDDQAKPELIGGGSTKQPSRLIATGHAVVVVTDLDEATQELRGRARLAGPSISVDLRREASKMLIEGQGSLLLEDFRVAGESRSASSGGDGGLFGMDETVGLSKTLIEWRQAMHYDFALSQVRFEGDVDLKHFSGQELGRVADLSRWSHERLPPGRATFLVSEILTVDFVNRADRLSAPRETRMGRLSAQKLEQFQASGEVTLQDQRPSVNITLTADDVAYEKDRDILTIHGRGARPARLISRKPNEAPSDYSFDRAFYEIGRGRLDVDRPMTAGQ